MKNITDKPTAAMGNTFSDLWFLVFGGISHLANMKRIQYNHDLEEYRKLLENSIDQIPKEKRIEPSIQTTAQALENSKYCVDQENFDQDNLINSPPPKIVRVSQAGVENIKIRNRQSSVSRPTFYSPASSCMEIKNTFKSSLSLEKIKKI